MCKNNNTFVNGYTSTLYAKVAPIKTSNIYLYIGYYRLSLILYGILLVNVQTVEVKKSMVQIGQVQIISCGKYFVVIKLSPKLNRQ